MDLEYGLMTLKNLDKAELNKWYPFSKAKERSEDLLEVVKLRIDLSGDFLISNDYTHFKRIESVIEKLKDLSNSNITYTIEWREDTGELTEKERNLEPQIKPIDKKRWDKLTGRAT